MKTYCEDETLFADDGNGIKRKIFKCEEIKVIEGIAFRVAHIGSTNGVVILEVKDE